MREADLSTHRKARLFRSLTGATRAPDKLARGPLARKNEEISYPCDDGAMLRTFSAYLSAAAFALFPLVAGAQSQAKAPPSLPEGKAKPLVEAICSSCHALQTDSQQLRLLARAGPRGSIRAAGPRLLPGRGRAVRRGQRLVRAGHDPSRPRRRNPNGGGLRLPREERQAARAVDRRRRRTGCRGRTEAAPRPVAGAPRVQGGPAVARRPQ